MCYVFVIISKKVEVPVYKIPGYQFTRLSDHIRKACIMGGFYIFLKVDRNKTDLTSFDEELKLSVHSYRD